MKKICVICGKEFNGRANNSVCSGACRIERNKRYAAKYRKQNPDKYRELQRSYYQKRKIKEYLGEIKHSDNIDLNFIPAPIPEKPKQEPQKKKTKKPQPEVTGSRWAKQYTKADRLTKITMLSWQLSKYNIAHLSYGELSLLWDTEKYTKLLNQVVKIKRSEDSEQ